MIQDMLTRLKLNLKTRKIKKQKDELVQYSVGLRDYCRGEPTSKTCDCEVVCRSINILTILNRDMNYYLRIHAYSDLQIQI